MLSEGAGHSEGVGLGIKEDAWDNFASAGATISLHFFLKSNDGNANVH